jgi:hypothetical protein
MSKLLIRAKIFKSTTRDFVDRVARSLPRALPPPWSTCGKSIYSHEIVFTHVFKMLIFALHAGLVGLLNN